MSGKQYFTNGEEKLISVEMSGISKYTVTKPDGWKASLTGKGLTITAPVAENQYAETSGKVAIMAVQSKSEEQIKVILDMSVIYLNVNDYRNKAKNIILTYKNVDADVEFPLAKMFYDKYVDAERDKVFLLEFMKTKVSRRLVRAFVRYLEVIMQIL